MPMGADKSLYNGCETDLTTPCSTTLYISLTSIHCPFVFYLTLDEFLVGKACLELGTEGMKAKGF